MSSHDVYITSRQKSRQSTMCIVIKGVEKFITNIYDARHQLLKLTSERIVGAIPSSYYGPNDMAHFKNSSIAQLMAGPMTYGPISPIQQIPQISWPQEMTNWRSRPPVTTLTSSLLQQHNQMTGNLQVPNSSLTSRGSVSDMAMRDLQVSGYSFSDNSMMKSSSGIGSSAQSSPENKSTYGGKYNPTINGMMESPHQSFLDHSRQSEFNEFYDRRIIPGLRAMNMMPQQGEARIPTPICKRFSFAYRL